MTQEDKDLLNAYHRRVYDAIAPHLPPEEAAWLKTATRPI
jgi:Xaa-Pro aminopeptidase